MFKVGLRGVTAIVLYHLIYVSVAYIPNMRPLIPNLHVEKFMVVVVVVVGVKCEFMFKFNQQLVQA